MRTGATKLIWVLAIVALVLALPLGSRWLQRRLTYLPMGARLPAVESVLPGAETVRFPTPDGLELTAWYLDVEPSRRRGTAIVLHGNAGTRALRAPLAEALARLGFATLLVDWRGYAGNPGRPTERGLIDDARGARAWLEARTEAGAGPVLLFGESLGAAVALAAALDRPPAALVLRSPFASLGEVARVHYPFVVSDRMLADRYPSVERARRLEAPLLVVAGDTDGIVPPEQSREVYDAAPVERKRFVLVPGAGHNDFELLAGERLLDAIDTFWREAVESAGPPAHTAVPEEPR